VSNEQTNQTDVYFDDVKMTYTPSNILQSNEYYPFGLQTASSWTRDNTVTNNFLANGGTELNTTSALYDLQYRNYDAALGRFHQVDPLADMYGSHSVYHYSYNNPVSYNDRNGAWSDEFAFGQPPMMDGMYKRGGGGRSPDADHPFAGMVGAGLGGFLDMFGDVGSGGSSSSGDSNDPYGDAAKVKNGQMTQEEYLDKYRESSNSYWLVYNENEKADGSVGWSFSLYHDQSYWNDAGANFSSSGEALGFGVYKNGYGADYWWSSLNTNGNGSKEDPNTASMINGMSFGVGTFLNILDWTVKGSVAKYAKQATEYAKDITQSAAKYSTKLAGVGLLISLGVGGYELNTTGNVSTSTQLDLFFGGLAFVPGADLATVIYAGANIGTTVVTGQSIGQNIDNYYWIPTGIGLGVVPIPKH
jgi:RHS repeat-associated protein